MILRRFQVYENFLQDDRYTDVGDVISITVPQGKYFVIGKFDADFHYGSGSNTKLWIKCNGTPVRAEHNHGYAGQSQIMTLPAIVDAPNSTNTITLSISGQSGTGDIAWGFHILAFRIG